MWAIKYYLTTNRINIKTRVDLKRESLGLLFEPKNIKIERYLSKAVFRLKNKLLLMVSQDTDTCVGFRKTEL
jgi:hypothetical protein